MRISALVLIASLCIICDGCAHSNRSPLTSLQPSVPAQLQSKLSVPPASLPSKTEETSLSSLLLSETAKQSQESSESEVITTSYSPQDKNPSDVIQQVASESDQIAMPIEVASAAGQSHRTPSSSYANSYTLPQLEQLALDYNPSIAAARAISIKAVGLRNQVGIAPNPTVGYFGQQLADKGTDQQGLFFEQEIVRGNKLAINQEVLGHTTNAQAWETEAQRYRVLTDVRVRFYEAVAAERQFDATNEFVKIAQRGVEIAIDRENAAEGSQLEVLQAKTLLSEMKLSAQQADVAYRGAWKDLAAIAGISDQVPAHLEAELKTPETTPGWQTTYSNLLSQSPELAVANAIVCEKAALLKRQRVQMVPNLTTQLQAGYDNGTDSGMLNVQIGAPIPVWNRNSGNISAAYSEYTRAVKEVERIQQSIKSRLARTSQDYESAFAAVTSYEQEIMPQASKSLELSEHAYQAGELEFLQVLIVRRSYYESRMKLIAAQGQLAQSQAQLDGLLLTGGLDASQDYTDGVSLRDQSIGGQ